jgi:acyl carrier protein
MVMEKVSALLAEQFEVDATSITADTDFVQDLNADSLDVVDMLMSLEDAFDVEIPDEEIENFRTPTDIQNYILERTGGA